MAGRMGRVHRRSFLRIGSALPGLAAAARSSRGARPNILWILAEDFSPDLGCYGNELVSTPNLDRLAGEGVRYTNCICTAPVCSAARSALMTGMFQTSIGAHNHRSHRDRPYELPDGVRTITDLFREAGYHTSNCKTPADGLAVRGKTDFNFRAAKPFDGADWSERPVGAPFYAQVNFPETHRKFRRFDESPVDPGKVPLPPFYPDHPVVREDVALYLDTAQHLDVKVGAVIRRLKAEDLYERTVIFFFGDHGQALHRGKQWLYEQGVRIPLIVRIPEAFRPPGCEPGSLDDRLVQHIDIAVNSLRLAGIEPAASMQGRLFLGSNAGPEREFAFSARDRCDETVDRIRCVRDKRWKLIRNFMPERPYAQKNHYKDTSYPALQVMRQLHANGELRGAPAQWMAPRRPEYELYDLDADPHEVENLAGDPEHATTLVRLQGVLEAWIEESNDHGRVLEGPLPAEYSLRTMADGWYTNNGLIAKSGGVLSMEWQGRSNRAQEAVVPCVERGGRLRLTLEMRTGTAQDLAIRWGNPANMGGLGSKTVGLAAGDGWQRISADFDCDGWLAWFSIRFGNGPSRVECRRASLMRRDSAGTIREWGFG